MNRTVSPLSRATHAIPLLKNLELGAALGLVLWLGLVGCSKQSEGDRCATENANQDCESGLVCVDATDLRGGVVDEVSRCCPPEGSPVSDGRCTRLVGGGSGTGTGNEAGQGGEMSSSGTTASSQACDYNSDCPTGMVCGPQGNCQDECREDRDCAGGESCVEGSCVVAGSAGGGS